jgi:gentisate 1,2-dioxygenase
MTCTGQHAAQADRNGQAAVDELHREVAEQHMFPFWAVNTQISHDEIERLKETQKAVPFVWKYKRAIEPLLYKSAALITTDTSERTC